MITMNQLLNLLLLVVLLVMFVINLASCSSSSLCDITSYRQLAAPLRPKCQKLGQCGLREAVVKRALKQAGVVLDKVIEAYRVCTFRTTLDVWSRKLKKCFEKRRPCLLHPKR